MEVADVRAQQVALELRVTSVLVTHDQDEAMVLSDQIVIMHKGRVQQIGSAIGTLGRGIVQGEYRHSRGGAAQVEDIGTPRIAGAGVLARTQCERGPHAVDQAVGDRGRDDLSLERVRGEQGRHAGNSQPQQHLVAEDYAGGSGRPTSHACLARGREQREGAGAESHVARLGAAVVVTTVDRTLGLLAGNGRVESGTIRLNGTDITHWSQKRLDSIRGAVVRI